jgi:hypothetical protein
MSSRGINFNNLQPEPEEPRGPVRRIIMGGGMSLEELVKELKDQFPFYGVLLPDPDASRINSYIRAYWDRLDKMSGETCLLISPVPPEKPTDEMRALLDKLVGPEKAAQAWEKYHAAPEQMINDVYTQAAALDVGYNRLPCLVLMTDLASDRKLIQRLPNWESDDLTRFFADLFTRINSHRHASDGQQRLDALKGDLGMRFMLGLQAARAARGIQETLANVEWSEVIKSTLTNETFLKGAFTALFGAFGVSVG